MQSHEDINGFRFSDNESGGGLGFAPYTAAAGALIGGIFAGSAARQNNAAVKQARDFSLARINDYIVQNRLDQYLNSERLARDAQISLGATLNVAPEGMAAIQTIASRIVAGVAADQFSIDEEARRHEAAALAEEQNVAAQAANQMTSVAGAVVQGALSGASTGFALGQAIDSKNLEDARAAAKKTEDASRQQVTNFNFAATRSQGTAIEQRNNYIASELNATKGLFDSVNQNTSALLGRTVFRRYTPQSY